MQKIQTDILIVGSGLAGLSLSKYLSEINPNLPILLLSKTSIDECNTYYAQGGIAVVHDFLKDSYKQHVEDTLKAGKGLCDEKVVQHVITEAPKRLNELLQWGVELDKNSQGGLELGLEGGHSQNRIVHHKDKTGYEIETKLIPLIEKLPNVTIKTSFFATDLIIENGHCLGLKGFDEKGEPTIIEAKATVLATGGSGQVFGVTSNPFVSTGDGVAMAIRSNVALQNMKYIQFHPTAMFEPRKSQAFLITEAIRGYGAHILNSNGERFLLEVHKNGELATRDVVSKAISEQMKKENGKNVWLDLRHLPIEDFKNKFPKVFNYCSQQGFDITQDLIPIAPAAHYQCGGIIVDEKGATDKLQLFAIGECSYTGLHGANRLASNSLLEAIVYSHDLADYLTSTVFTTQLKSNENAVLIYKNIHHDEVLQFRNQLQWFMKYESIYGEKQAIIKTYQLVSELLKRFRMKYKKYDNHPFLCETYNLIQTAEIILKESLPVSYKRNKISKKTKL